MPVSSSSRYANLPVFDAPDTAGEARPTVAMRLAPGAPAPVVYQHTIAAFETLEYLVRGGRIGKAAGLAGQLLSVKPILHFEDGEVASLKRVRGRAKALAEFERLFLEGTRDSQTLHVGVGHAAAQDDADALLALLVAAGVNFVMGVPGADDIMLGYQSTSFHDALAMRDLFGRRPAPEFEQWLTRQGLLDAANRIRPRSMPSRFRALIPA